MHNESLYVLVKVMLVTLIDKAPKSQGFTLYFPLMQSLMGSKEVGVEVALFHTVI